MEYKVMVARPKAIEGREVTGLAAITGNVDGGYDRIIKGAFRKTIKENGVRVRNLWMHDPMQPPTAVVKELVEVGREDLPEDLQKLHPEATGGLQVRREYLDTPRGNEILSGIKAGAISEMSIGYNPVKYDFEEGQKTEDGGPGVMVRNLRELRLWDVSDVTWGMNELTVAAKMDLGPFLERVKGQMGDEEFEVVSGLVRVVEEVGGRMPFAPTKAGRVLSARNLGRLREALDTLSEILLEAEPEEDDEKSLLTLTSQVLQRLAIAEHENYFYGLNPGGLR